MCPSTQKAATQGSAVRNRSKWSLACEDTSQEQLLVRGGSGCLHGKQVQAVVAGKGASCCPQAAQDTLSCGTGLVCSKLEWVRRRGRGSFSVPVCTQAGDHREGSLHPAGFALQLVSSYPSPTDAGILWFLLLSQSGLFAASDRNSV